MLYPFKLALEKAMRRALNSIPSSIKKWPAKLLEQLLLGPNKKLNIYLFPQFTRSQCNKANYGCKLQPIGSHWSFGHGANTSFVLNSWLSVGKLIVKSTFWFIHTYSFTSLIRWGASYVQFFFFACNETIWLTHHHSKRKLKLWRLPKTEGSISKYRVAPLWLGLIALPKNKIKKM
jgi:hypothetical protein